MSHPRDNRFPSELPWTWDQSYTSVCPKSLARLKKDWGAQVLFLLAWGICWNYFLGEQEPLPGGAPGAAGIGRTPSCLAKVPGAGLATLSPALVSQPLALRLHWPQCLTVLRQVAGTLMWQGALFHPAWLFLNHTIGSPKLWMLRWRLFQIFATVSITSEKKILNCLNKAIPDSRE